MKYNCRVTETKQEKEKNKQDWPRKNPTKLTENRQAALATNLK